MPYVTTEEVKVQLKEVSMPKKLAAGDLAVPLSRTIKEFFLMKYMISIS